MKLGNGLWEHATFNSRLQPTEIGIGTGQAGAASVDRLKLSLDYGATDNNGNVKSQTITVPTIGAVSGTTLTQCYTYDEFNRLKTAEEKSGATCTGAVVWTQKFTYDQQGNRRFDTGTTIPAGFPNPTMNTSNNNRIDAGQGYLYDLAGNVIEDPSHAYSFDAEERQATADNGATGTYSYDGNGQRVKSVTSAGTTLYVYDAMGRLIAEYTSGNATGSGTSYITADMLGSPRVITAQDKSVKARHDYLPFGEEIPAGYGSRTAQQGYITDTLRQKFTQKERDTESGLDYFLARYYSSAQGRFTSPDPIFISDWQTANPQLWNLYSYVGNNPLAYVDPTGMELVKLGQHTDDEIKRRQKEIDQQLKGLKKDKSLTKNQRKEQEQSLKGEKKTLSLEMGGNKVGRQIIADLNARGEGNGLQLSDLTLSTDSKNDFMSDPNFVKGAGGAARAQQISNDNATAGMFVFLGYSTQIYLNATSNDYAGYESGDADYITYGGTALRHEQFHLRSTDKSEHAAYADQLKRLQTYGPAAFKSREFYDRAIGHITKGSKRKD